MTEQVRDGVRDGFVVDVSRWPDAADLLLVADVLISDYSSAIFDFAHTDRPILLFTYDLDHYRGTLRGFNFDLAEKAPGPLLADSASLIEAVRNADAVGRSTPRRGRRSAPSSATWTRATPPSASSSGCSRWVRLPRSRPYGRISG
ncbi:hypothetical protein SAVIM40S_07638 [Streptomyces avidinii]